MGTRTFRRCYSAGMVAPLASGMFLQLLIKLPMKNVRRFLLLLNGCCFLSSKCALFYLTPKTPICHISDTFG